MRLQRTVQVLVVAGMVLAGAGLTGRGRAWGQATATAQGQAGGAAASAQGGTGTVLVPQTQVVYETVQSTQCVQVPVTHMQTCYRTEYRTETVPVTRMVPETVNEIADRDDLRASAAGRAPAGRAGRLRAGHDDAGGAIVLSR